jgi:hypothetical protein
MVLTLTFAAIALSACDPLKDAVNVIDKGIAELDRNSSAWQTVARDVAAQLPKDVQSSIRTEATELAERTVAKAGVEFRCNADFLAARVKQHLLVLRAKLKNEAPPEVPPTLCHTIPGDLDLNPEPRRRTKIEVCGYDLDRPDAKGHPFKVYLVPEGAGPPIELSEDRIGRTTHYSVVINVSGPDMEEQLVKKKIRKLRIAWGDKPLAGGGEVVVIPRILVAKADTAHVGTVSYTPPHVAYPPHKKGDADFDTHDDEPMSVLVIGETRLQDGKIQARVYMRAREERDDWTAAEGWSAWQDAYKAPTGWRIKQAARIGKSQAAVNVNQQGLKRQNLAEAETVYRFDIYGDHDGDDAGTYTHVDATFSDIPLIIEEIAPG